MVKRIVVLHEKDNVGVLLEKAKVGDHFISDGNEIEIIEDVEFGHKVALKDFREQDSVFKYGEEIGYAMDEIKKGQWVHNHNMGCRRGK